MWITQKQLAMHIVRLLYLLDIQLFNDYITILSDTKLQQGKRHYNVCEAVHFAIYEILNFN